MKIINLTSNRKLYTCNVYFILGEWKGLDDVNALIDVGRDPSIIDRIRRLDTGVGKKRVEKVVLTHGHFDHVSLLPAIKDEFAPKVYAFHSINGASHALRDGQALKLADRWFEVMHTPGHTSDSICLYCAQEGVLFSGDTGLIITMTDGSYQEAFVRALERIARRDIKAIYPGHGDPITYNAKRLIYMSLDNVRKGKVIENACNS